MRAVADLPPRDFGSLFPLLLRDQVFKQPGADHIGALPNDQRTVAILGLDEIDASVKRAVWFVLARAWRFALHPLRYGADMLGCGATAAADEVQPAVIGEFFQLRRERLRRFQIFPILVRQPRVGIAGDEIGR